MDSSLRPASAPAALASRRTLPYPPAAVFAAFADPERLARWWEPRGFTSTFDVFEFRPDGPWRFVMHGPDGTRHPNTSVFRAVQAPSRIVIEHVSPPQFILTVSLTAQGGQTSLEWVQVFGDPEVAARLRHIAEPANEQNLDRLTAELARTGR